MLEYLYALFIAPLEWLMQAVLEKGFTIFGSYGAALICMSIVVNLLLLPLYHLAETWQESERRVQHDMHAYLEHIKATFKGRERFMLISALYKIHGYHPVFAVRTSFGFLIQVPFFFAAYHFLSHYAPLSGTSFWIFHNLAEPDALLHVAGLDINVLPWAMTVINIVSALVYTNRLSRRDKIQLYVVAAIFLVLLYTAPSGLVFYWTCNNIFSLLKNMVYEELGIFSHGESGREKPRARLVLEKAALFVEQRVSAPWTTGLLAIAYCMDIVRCLLEKWTAVQDLGPVLWPVSAFVFGLCLVLLLLVTFAWCLAGRLNFGIWTILVAASFYVGVVCHLPYLKSFLLLGLFLPVVLCYQEGSFAKWLDKLAFRFEKKELASYTLKALAFIALTMFVATPAMLISQDASMFSTVVLAVLTLAAAGFIILPYCVFSLSRPSLRLVLTVCFCIAAFVAFVYTWMLDRDYGVLDGGFLTDEVNLTSSWYKYVDLAVCLLLTSVVVFLLAVRRRLLGIVLNIGLVMTALMGGWNWYNVVLAIEHEQERSSVAETVRKEKPIQLSRVNPNVLVIMLDMFTGDHVAYIREEHPDIVSGYEGFTWYPDTISEGSSTVISLDSIVAGPKNAARNLLEDDGRSLEEKITGETEAFFGWLVQKGYTAKYADSEITDFPSDPRYTEQNLYRRLPDVQKQNIVALPASFGVFKAMPWSLRNRIYNFGLWIEWLNVGTNQGSKKYRTKTARHYAVLKNLEAYTSFDDGPSHYTFFHNELNHFPWHFSGQTFEPDDSLEEFQATDREIRDGRIPRHYYTEVASFKLIGNFLEKMKQEGVYDNTLIIICSDHCQFDSQPLHDVFGGGYPGRPGALLMVKPAGAHGAMRVDDAPMASSDVRMIVEAAIENKAFKPAADRVRYHALGISYMRKKYPKNNFVLHSLWEIHGDRMHREHWKVTDRKK